MSASVRPPLASAARSGMIVTSQLTPRDAGGVVALGTDRARDMRPVAVVVERGVVLLDEVPAARVVDLAVPVLVPAAGRVVVDPDVRREVGVRVGDAAVDHGDDHVAAPRVQVPGLGRVDVVVGGLVEAPEVREARVVRHRRGQVRDVVRLGELDGGVVLERLGGRGDRGALGQLDECEALLAEPLHEARTARPESAAPRGGRGAAAELDDQLAGDESLSGEAAAPLKRRVADDGALVGAGAGRSRNQGAGEHNHRRPKETRPHRI